MYALSGVQGFEIPVEEVRTTLGWKPKRNIQGIFVLDAAESETLQDLLTLDPAAAEQPELPDPDGESAAIAAFTRVLEATSQRAYRREQAALKRRLLRGPTGKCALCGNTLPVTFLVAAHIKKRARCNNEEKRDLANIAMLACTFGCDVLYEHGYITVQTGGALQVIPLAGTSSRIAAYIQDTLEGRTVDWWGRRTGRPTTTGTALTRSKAERLCSHGAFGSPDHDGVSDRLRDAPAHRTARPEGCPRNGIRPIRPFRPGRVNLSVSDLERAAGPSVSQALCGLGIRRLTEMN